MRRIYSGLEVWLFLVLFAGAFNPLLAGSLEDIRPQGIIVTSPEGNTSGVDPNTPISVTFSEGINPLALNPDLIHLYQMEGSEDLAILGKIKYDNMTKKAYFIPEKDLYPATNYKVVIERDVEIDSGGVLKAGYSWEFTTRIGTGGCGGS
ncbi:MAG TPA: Ig-like domain-containing protein [Candidatus Brocadiales bacterium]|nr:Ig-like domain-containing protein [Candidatus Brocadiales bacterium]